MKTYSVTKTDKQRTLISWKPDKTTFFALFFKNQSHIDLIPQILEEAGYELRIKV